MQVMTEEESARLVQGFGWGFGPRTGFFVGSILAVPRLGVPSINMQALTRGALVARVLSNLGYQIVWWFLLTPYF